MSWFQPGPERPQHWRMICLSNPAPLYNGFKGMVRVTYAFTVITKGSVVKLGEPETVEYLGERRCAFRIFERREILYVLLRDVADKNLSRAVHEFRREQRSRVAVS